MPRPFFLPGACPGLAVHLWSAARRRPERRFDRAAQKGSRARGGQDEGQGLILIRVHHQGRSGRPHAVSERSEGIGGCGKAALRRPARLACPVCLKRRSRSLRAALRKFRSLPGRLRAALRRAERNVGRLRAALRRCRSRPGRLRAALRRFRFRSGSLRAALRRAERNVGRPFPCFSCIPWSLPRRPFQCFSCIPWSLPPRPFPWISCIPWSVFRRPPCGDRQIGLAGPGPARVC